MNSSNFFYHAFAFFIIVGSGVCYELYRSNISHSTGEIKFRYFLVFVYCLAPILLVFINLTYGRYATLNFISVFVPLFWIFTRSSSYRNKRQYLSQEDMIISCVWPAIVFSIFKVMALSNIYEAGLFLRIITMILAYLCGLTAVWYGGIPRYVCYWCLASFFLIASYHFIFRPS